MLIAIIATSIILLYLPFNPTIRKLFKRNWIAVGFLYSLVATFSGVFLSLHLADLQTREKQRQTTSHVLEKINEGLINKLRWYGWKSLHVYGPTEEEKRQLALISFVDLLRIGNFLPLIQEMGSQTIVSPEFYIKFTEYLDFVDNHLNDMKKLQIKDDHEIRNSFEDYETLLLRTLFLVEIEKARLTRAISDEAFTVLFRCKLDPSQAPMSEMWSVESGCENKILTIRNNLPENILNFKEFINGKLKGPIY